MLKLTNFGGLCLGILFELVNFKLGYLKDCIVTFALLVKFLNDLLGFVDCIGFHVKL